MKSYFSITFEYKDKFESFHHHYLRKKDMKYAMYRNYCSWDTFSFGMIIPKLRTLRRNRNKEIDKIK
jgi:hypothetical protein